MKHILVTGSQGQLGQSLRLLAPTTEYSWTFTDVAELDITDRQAVLAYFEKHGFDACINCAAYTAVDKAESEPEKARAINARGPENLAEACRAAGGVLVQVSTDFVFDGQGGRPYPVDAPTRPLSVYGQTKREAEERVLAINPRTLVVRTAWLYSTFGSNFVKTMLRLGRERGALNVVADQVGSPTYAPDLAAAIVRMLARVPELDEHDFGIYHYTNEGLASWYDFAHAIFELAEVPVALQPIPTAAYPTPARRPAFSVLDKQRAKQVFGLVIPHWRESLKRCLTALNQNA